MKVLVLLITAELFINFNVQETHIHTHAHKIKYWSSFFKYAYVHIC